MVLYVDGGCTQNGQPDMSRRRMVMVVADESGAVISERTAQGGSNNIAELEAVRDALAWCVEHDIQLVEIRTDSRNNLSWVLGKKVGKQINDRARVLALKEEIETIRRRVALVLNWVPREENKAGHYIEGVYAL